MMLLAAFNLINHMAEKTLGCSPISKNTNRISGVMVSVLNSSAVDRGFRPRSGQTKDYEIGICCFSIKHTA